MIKIDKNIPLPKKTGRDEDYLILKEMFNKMKIGDSTLLTLENYKRFQHSLCLLRQETLNNIKFKVYKECENKYRFFRTK
jgi:hypothetical protein